MGNSTSGRGIFGIILLLIGLGILLRTFDVFPHRIEHILFSWEMILILVGAFLTSTKENRGTGIVLILVGAIFLLPDLRIVPFPMRKLVWGALFIVIGLAILLRGSWSTFGKREHIDKSNRLEDFSMFGGGDRIINAENFEGGRITAIFGGSKIDLRNSTLAQGQNIVDTLCLFGGTTLIVPEDWDVRTEVISIFGGFSDKRHKIDTTKDGGKVLIIKGLALFGGGEIKN